jgi:hypothetical protein
MNFKNVFLILCISILLFSLSSVFAESFDLQGNTFEVPQGYSINKTSDLSTKMVKNNNTNYTVFVSVNNFTDSNASINSRQVSGFRFLAEENFVSENNIPVTQQNYIKNESYYSYYSFDINGAGYLIGYSFPVHDDDLGDKDSNPALKIIESINV